MYIEEIKRGLRGEIKKRENEQYCTCETNIRQMCKDVLAKIEEQESMLAEKDKELRNQKYKRCLTMARWCVAKSNYHFVLARHGENCKENNRRSILYAKWHKRWLEIAEKFKE